MTTQSVVADPVVLLVNRIRATQWLELPVASVASEVLTAAVATGVVQITRDGPAKVVRLLPDPACKDAAERFTAEGASTHALCVWGQRYHALANLLALVQEQTPEDTTTIEALTNAATHAARLRASV
jgi:hypothetical protein